MKKYILWFVLLYSMLFLQAENNVFEFDIITCDDKTSNLNEPDGVIKIVIKLDKKVKDEHVDFLYEKGALPVLRKARKKLEKALLDLEKATEELEQQIENGDNVKQAMNELKKLISQENNVFHESKIEAKEKAEKEMLDLWKELRKNEKAYTRYKIKFAGKIIKELITLAASITALMNGYAPAYISTVASAISLLETLSQWGLDTADIRDDVEFELNNLHLAIEKLSKQKNPKRKKSLEGKVKKFQKSTKKQLKKYRAALGKLQKKFFKTVKKIKKLEGELEKAKKKTDSEKIAKITKKVKKLQKKIKGMGSSIVRGIKFIKKVEPEIESEKKSFAKRLKSLATLKGLLGLATDIATIAVELKAFTE